MKIGVISYAFYPRLSGVANVVKSLYSRLIKNNPNKIEKIAVLAYKDNASLPEIETIEQLEVTRFTTPSLFSGRIPLIGWDFLNKANNFIDKKNIDQLHIHTRYSIVSFVCLIIAKMKKIEVYHYEHLGDHIKGEGFLVNTLCYLWDMTISRFIFVFSDKIIAVSKSISDFIITNFNINPDKIVIIENGCDLEPSPISFEEKFSNNNEKKKEKFNILFASRFVPLKNPLITLQAIKLISNKGVKNIHFNIAGAGKLQDQIVQYIKENNMKEYASFLGKLDQSQMKEIITQNDILINCSMLEGFPGIVLESIYQNNFAIVTNVCGNNDIVKSKDYLIELEELSAQQIADKIEYIMQNSSKLSKEMDQTKLHLIKNNNWDVPSQKLLKICL